MTFWIGIIVGLGVGLIVSAAFFMWLFKVALTRRDSNDSEFLKTQKQSSENLKAIADAVATLKERDK